MKKLMVTLACSATYWACVIGAGIKYGIKAAVIVAVAAVPAAIIAAMQDPEEPESDYDFDARVIVHSGEVRITEKDARHLLAIIGACKAVLEQKGIDADDEMKTIKINRCVEVSDGSLEQ